jgi:hypothetical protein
MTGNRENLGNQPKEGDILARCQEYAVLPKFPF